MNPLVGLHFRTLEPTNIHYLISKDLIKAHQNLGIKIRHRMFVVKRKSLATKKELIMTWGLLKDAMKERNNLHNENVKL